MAAAPTSHFPRGPRDRSRVVCQRCHARKVKCDLILKIHNGGSCTNCEKRGEVCQRRESTRLQKRRDRALEVSALCGLPLNNDPRLTPPTPSLVDSQGTAGDISDNERQPNLPQSTSAETDDQGYIGEFSVMSNHGPLPSDVSAIVGSFSRSIEEQTLAATRADQLPPQSLIDAHVSAYFKYLYHRIPVVSRQDVTVARPSALLLQSLCLAGSILRHPKSAKSLVESEKHYARAKTLFYTNHEHDPLSTLKALCLLTLWNVTPPSVVTADCSWNWLGLATRLAFQMGLHRESTYSKRPVPCSARRIVWFLYAQDKLYSACFGRPQILKTEDFDLHPPSITDFEESESGQARLFVLYTNLMTILARMLPLSHQNLANTPEEVLAILSDMQKWAGNIPSDLRIFDDQGVLIYQRDFYEVLIWHFTCIITFFHIHGRFFHPSATSTISLVASSCIVRLYQEMDYRDDINYLMAINNWSMMVASLPQLYNIRENYKTRARDIESGADALPWEELDVLLEILTQRTLKFPGAQAIVERIVRMKSEILSHGTSTQPLSGIGYESEFQSVSNWRTYLTVPGVYELFPFSKALTPRMELLSKITIDDVANRLPENFPDWSIENLLNLDNYDSFF
ncbi:hypothetical protein ASPSYDRAFT_90599 [Aspergillus sydowii CBS 593.65]|uniref:Zn(2)-C6 fungal-type domain-containing protein n=1 Tax=Aspergillus sydowii CBS 593.65 TaxID=1036612 RepID=A0A1L9TD09_9EURO|nr:uncharacterized protein ASPSYDRAFT_90599 [Aspergillus sydowii CBS 593.65]OJJ57302.1 hypothetical protein ASPSYDRAFT_90599 [Aspergillus sydowii CBS 593.65]